MNLDELRSAQAKERRKDSLQHLRDSFYDDVGAYVADLRAARDRRAEQVENPFADDDVRRLSDEVETAEEVAEALYERRVGKVVKLASFAAADMSVDEEGMTTEERRLFDDLVERITANKSEVLDVLAGESPVQEGSPIRDESSTADGASTARDAGGSRDTTPTDATPNAPAAEAETPPAGTEPDPTGAGDASPESGSAAADALAGAMGGGETESTADAPAGPTEGDADPAAPEPTGDAGTAGDGEPTPVPPEPAPPGAVGVDDDPDGTSTGDADEEPTAGATTDGGAVPEGTATGSPPAEAEPSADPEPAAGSEPATDTEPAGGTERATVRITRDVGAIFGVDEREYELASEDVVSLPVENADPLVQRDAAERID
jgi:DNA replication factor GINS